MIQWYAYRYLSYLP